MRSSQFHKQHLHIFASIGWRFETVELPTPASRALRKLGFDVTAVHTLETKGGKLALLQLASHQLPDPAAVMGAFVETTWEVHSLLRWCAATLEADAALLIDPAVVWLHRIAATDHCVACADAQSIEDRLLPVFAGESDPVATILRWQRESTEAQGRGLRQWFQLWERRLGESCRLDVSDARRLIQHLVLTRKCRTIPWVRDQAGIGRMLDRSLELLEGEETESALNQALRAVDLMARDMGIAACARGPAERTRVGEALARSELTVGALLRSIELVGASHLRARTHLSAEAEPELQRASWRLIVEDADPMRRSSAGATPHEAARRRLDVLEVGYEYALHVFDATVRWIVDFNRSLTAEYAQSNRQAFQPDFLTLADGGVDPAGFISDPFHFALRHVVEIVASLPPQNRLIKWLLTLRIFELTEELDLSPERFPDLDQLC